MDWRHDGASCSVTMFTTRDCKKGEELCISYIGAGDKGNGMKVGDRRKKLMGWFGMDCRCVKCATEAAEEDAASKKSSGEGLEVVLNGLSVS